jgi:hypothetical protein
MARYVSGMIFQLHPQSLVCAFSKALHFARVDVVLARFLDPGLIPKPLARTLCRQIVYTGFYTALSWVYALARLGGAPSLWVVTRDRSLAGIDRDWTYWTASYAKTYLLSICASVGRPIGLVTLLFRWSHQKEYDACRTPL